MPEDLVALDNETLYTRMCGARRAIQSGALTGKQLLTSPLAEEVKRRSKFDLYFLAKYLIGFGGEQNSLMNERTHRALCDLFVKKDPSKTIAEQDTFKERLLLYPRGSFKSRINVIDAVQWVLCFPDIRIGFLTAADDLAILFIKEFKDHFVIKEDPDFMNIFFPEFCIPDTREAMGDKYEFTSPMRKVRQKEPTAMVLSVTSTASGFHFDVVKPDDAVSEKNSENEIQCKRVSKLLSIKKKMLMVYGYWELTGTRYDDMDVYGEMLERNVGEVERISDHPCRELIINRTTGSKYLIGRAIVVKPGFEDKNYKEAGEANCHLLFPEYLNYSFLINEFFKDEVVFEGQYNQNPRPKSHINFDRPLLERHTIPYTQLPVSGPIAITWDFAFSQKKGRDFSTAAVGIFNDKGHLFVIDLIRQRFSPTGLAVAVVDLVKKWRPVTVGIEDAAGSRLSEPTILQYARESGRADVLATCSRIDWFTPDQQADAKMIRMLSMHPWLVNDRMWFAAGLPQIQTLYTEFERCTMGQHRRNDIPDVISQLLRYAPRMYAMITKNELTTWSREDAAHNLIFEENCDAFGRPGLGIPPAPLVPVVDKGLDAIPSSNELEPLLGSGLIG